MHTHTYYMHTHSFNTTVMSMLSFLALPTQMRVLSSVSTDCCCRIHSSTPHASSAICYWNCVTLYRLPPRKHPGGSIPLRGVAPNRHAHILTACPLLQQQCCFGPTKSQRLILPLAQTALTYCFSGLVCCGLSALTASVHRTQVGPVRTAKFLLSVSAENSS